MSNKGQRFSDLKANDLRPWLGLPVTGLLLDHLHQERDSTKDAISDYVFRNEVEDARVASGGLRVIETLLALFAPPEAEVPDAEDEFVDPGTIPPPPVAAT